MDELQFQFQSAWINNCIPLAALRPFLPGQIKEIYPCLLQLLLQDDLPT